MSLFTCCNKSMDILKSKLKKKFRIAVVRWVEAVLLAVFIKARTKKGRIGARSLLVQKDMDNSMVLKNKATSPKLMAIMDKDKPIQLVRLRRR